MKRIVCAVDYSENSVIALKYALAISKTLEANVLVTHVYTYPMPLELEDSYPIPDLVSDTYREEHAKLEEFCVKHLGEDVYEMNVSMEVVEGIAVVDTIVEKANEIQAFMIVTGMKGMSLLKDIIMGNTTRQLIDKANCLVLAVPSDANCSVVKTIVYATDFDADADIEVIKKISGIAKGFGATLKVVHISTQKDYEVESQMEWFKTMLKEKVDYDKITFEIIFSEAIYESLRVYLGDVGADMVVLLEREENGFLKKVFHRDIVKKLEGYGKVPVMSFNEKNFGMFRFLDL
ncbi:universal stress protein [Winogradskyella sp. PC D3.3]